MAKDLEKTISELRLFNRALNDLVDEICDLRETVALLDKVILDKIAPVPAMTTKKPKAKRSSEKKAREPASPVERSPEASCACGVLEETQTAQIQVHTL